MRALALPVLLVVALEERIREALAREEVGSDGTVRAIGPDGSGKSMSAEAAAQHAALLEGNGTDPKVKVEVTVTLGSPGAGATSSGSTPDKAADFDGTYMISCGPQKRTTTAPCPESPRADGAVGAVALSTGTFTTEYDLLDGKTWQCKERKTFTTPITSNGMGSFSYTWGDGTGSDSPCTLSTMKGTDVITSTCIISMKEYPHPDGGQMADIKVITNWVKPTQDQKAELAQVQC